MPSKAQSRKERNIRKGHMHSPPVRKLEIVAANMRVSLDNVHQSSGALQGTIHRARDKSPTQGAYAPIYGQGQGQPKERVTPKAKRKFEGEVFDPRIPPERAFRKHKNKLGFRKFNPTGNA